MPKWPTWEDGECEHCGVTAAQVNEGEVEPEPHYIYICPSCDRAGCSECMPLGRGCECPECENGETSFDY